MRAETASAGHPGSVIERYDPFSGMETRREGADGTGGVSEEG
jgi:hypothetical protein